MNMRWMIWIGLCFQVHAQVLINEFVANHTGSDTHEYIEIYGLSLTDYSSYSVLVIDGDLNGNPGQVLLAVQAGTTDGDGIWCSGFLDNQIQNGSMTLILVNLFTGNVGDDLDSDNDGVLDATPWSGIEDDVAVDDGGAGDQVYSTIILNSGFDGGIYTVGGASRIPNGTDSNTIGDWKRNDFYGKGLPGYSGSLDPGEALNTPCAINTDVLIGSAPLLTEFVVHHQDGDTMEYVEIHGDPGSSYASSSILVLDGDQEGNPGQINQIVQVGTTNGGGFWVSAYQQMVWENGSQSLLLVQGSTSSPGDDLDGDDDGILDSEPWSQLQDSVSLNDGDQGDQFYAPAIVLATTSNPGGASRYPYATDTDTAQDWVLNDFQGAGLPGLTGLVESGEAYNTPGRVTQIFTPDYYSPVVSDSPQHLRTSLHELIDDHIRFDYTSSLTDTWDILELADQDPLDANRILTLYRNRPYAKAGGGNSNYNREHTWPKSYGFPDNTTDCYPHTDCHHLMLADIDYNSSRSNIVFGTCSTGCNELGSDAYNGQGGGSGAYPGNSNWYSGNGNSGSFEVWQDRRGDIARAMFYMDVRYEGGQHSYTAAAEPDLVLTDDESLMVLTGINTSGSAYMGRLSTLLQWHLEDPVDEAERQRNDVVAGFQGNRNPFVDHPEWVDCLFNGTCDTSCFLQWLDAWRVDQDPCQAGILNVTGLVAMFNGSCSCN